MKKILEKYLLKSQLWVSVMISCLCLFFQNIFEEVDYYRIIIVFLSTFIGYNYIQYHKVWIKELKKRNNFTLCVIAFIVLSILLFKKPDIDLLLHLCLFGFFVLLYNSYFIPLKIREIPVLKIFVIAFVWTGIILFIGSNSIVSGLTFFSIFLFIVGLTIPFDVVDISQDSVKTIPVSLGINKSIYLAIFCFTASVTCFYLSFTEEYLYLTVWGLTNVIAVLLVIFIKNNNNYFYTRFWIESCSALPFIIEYLLK